MQNNHLYEGILAHALYGCQGPRSALGAQARAATQLDVVVDQRRETVEIGTRTDPLRTWGGEATGAVVAFDPRARCWVRCDRRAGSVPAGRVTRAR